MKNIMNKKMNRILKLHFRQQMKLKPTLWSVKILVNILPLLL